LTSILSFSPYRWGIGGLGGGRDLGRGGDGDRNRDRDRDQDRGDRNYHHRREDADGRDRDSYRRHSSESSNRRQRNSTDDLHVHDNPPDSDKHSHGRRREHFNSVDERRGGNGEGEGDGKGNNSDHDHGIGIGRHSNSHKEREDQRFHSRERRRSDSNDGMGHLDRRMDDHERPYEYERDFVQGRARERYPGDRRRDRDRDCDRDRDYDPDQDRDHDYDRDREDHHRMKRPRRDFFPPRFESSSADYSFDAQTGFFVEEQYDFFYDPKSKLYFSNERKMYYRHEDDTPPKKTDLATDTSPRTSSPMTTEKTAKDDKKKGTRPPKSSSRDKAGKFLLVEESEGKALMKFGNDHTNEVDVGQDLIVQALKGGNKSSTANSKKKISISIKSFGKTKKKDQKSKQKHSKVEKVLEKQVVEKQPLTVKAHEADMEMWSLRGKERGTDNDDNATSCRPADILMDCHSAKAGNGYRKTRSGKPICLICKRKFIDLQSLRRHLMSSDLHTWHLQNSSSSKNPEDGSKYIDRAHHRRTMYDSGHTGIMDPTQVIMAPSLNKARDVVMTEASNPIENLGASNVGNQLLRKLTKKSEALQGTGGDIKKREASDHLRKEWERIESLAASNKRSSYRR